MLRRQQPPVCPAGEFLLAEIHKAKKASLEKGGEPAKLVEGYSCGIFCFTLYVLGFTEEIPQSSLRLASSLFKGALL